MLNPVEQLKLSEYAGLYDRIIPEHHILRKFNELVNFDFIYKELEEKYCLTNGRTAISPILLFKYLILKVMYNMSDREIVDRSRYDMSFKYFVGLRPEDDVINPSTLTKFRKLRLKDGNLLDLLLKKSVEIALANGIIKSKNIIVDATHTKARYNLKSAWQQLMEQAKLLRKTVYQNDSEEWKSKFPKKIENGLIEDALAYCEKLLAAIEAEPKTADRPAIREKINLLRETVEDHAEHLAQSKDTDARVGHKTADTNFFGHKTHMAMTDERIVAAAVVTSGEKSDGEQLPTLIEKVRETGLEVENVIGDTAYSGKDNLALAESEDEPAKKFNLVSKLNPVISNGAREEGENGFTFNKDADMYVCPAGHMAIRKEVHKPKKKGKNLRMVYHFDVGQCKNCPYAKGCYRSGAKTKTYSITILSDLHQKQKEFQETEEFKKIAATRYKIEAKNGEIKQRYGYDVASYSGLLGMEIQGATTLFVANIKRILRLKAE